MVSTETEKRKTRDFWDANPCVPELSFEERSKRFQLEESFMTKDFPFESSMDVGCGTGFEPIRYSKLGVGTVIGLDLTLNSLRIAKSRGNYGVDWVLGDAENLPFKDKSIDFVSAIGSLHHTPNTELAVREIERVSKKEIVVMLYNKWYRLSWRIRHLWAKPNYDNGAPIVKFYTGREVRKLFHRFRKIELIAFGYDAPFIFLKWAWYARAQK